MSRWFRMYEDLLDDPKVQKLEPVLFKTWVNLLCLASRNGGVLPSMEDIAFALRIGEDVAEARVSDLAAKGLIDGGQELAPHNWNERQFKSDRDETGAERQKRKRERDKTVTVTRDITDAECVTSRPPDTEQNRTDSDTEQSRTRERGASLDWGNLEADLRKAAGWQSEPHPSLCVVGPIVSLLETGASLDLDILPTIRAKAKSASAKGWGYFVEPIKDAMRRRLEARAPPNLTATSAERKAKADETLKKAMEAGWKPGTKLSAAV